MTDLSKIEFHMDFLLQVERLASEMDLIGMRLNVPPEQTRIAPDGRLVLQTALEHIEIALLSLSGLATGMPPCYSTLQACLEVIRNRKTASMEWLEKRAKEALAEGQTVQ